MNFGTDRKVPRILLVDDDEVFGKIMEKAARSAHIPLTHLKSPREISAANLVGRYDFMIVDYDLEIMSGLQFIKGVESFSSAPRCILVTSYWKLNPAQLPESVLAVLHKSLGPQQLLEAAVSHYSSDSPESIPLEKD